MDTRVAPRDRRVWDTFLSTECWIIFSRRVPMSQLSPGVRPSWLMSPITRKDTIKMSKRVCHGSLTLPSVPHIQVTNLLSLRKRIALALVILIGFAFPPCHHCSLQAIIVYPLGGRNPCIFVHLLEDFISLYEIFRNRPLTILSKK